MTNTTHKCLDKVLNTAHIVRMGYERLDEGLMKKWVNDVGGLATATRLISEALECSVSKAEKLAACRPSGRISASEQKVLAKLMKFKREVLFRLQTKQAS